MSTLNIYIKGKRDIYLTRNYNSLSVFQQNTDDIGFNDTVNDFSSWCISSSCGNAAVDKVKILSLPSKGRLFYLTNPGNPNPVYANVTIGQEILVADLVYNKVLKFSAEGSADGQFTENYIGDFRLERYCDSTGSNETVYVHLNMLDLKSAPSNIYASGITSDSESGTASFSLNVENQPFVGYICGITTNSSVNTRQKSVIISVAGTALNLQIDAGAPLGTVIRNNLPVNLPVGVYPGTIRINANLVPIGESLYVDAAIIYSLDTVYENGILPTNVQAFLRRDNPQV